jgi:hypothetical protein
LARRKANLTKAKKAGKRAPLRRVAAAWQGRSCAAFVALSRRRLQKRQRGSEAVGSFFNAGPSFVGMPLIALIA